MSVRKASFAAAGVVVRFKLNIAAPGGCRVPVLPEIPGGGGERLLHVGAFGRKLGGLCEPAKCNVALLQRIAGVGQAVKHIHIAWLQAESRFQGLARPGEVTRPGRHSA